MKTATRRSSNWKWQKTEMGKVIGRSGRIARALRTMLAAAGTKNNKRYALEILE